MPSKRKRDGTFKDIAYPLSNEVREAIEERVLLAYETATGNRAISRIERARPPWCAATCWAWRNSASPPRATPDWTGARDHARIQARWGVAKW